MSDLRFNKLFVNVSRHTEVNGHKFGSTAKAVYAYFYGFHSNGHSIYPSYDTLVYELGVGLKEVKNAVKMLEESGIVKSQRMYNNSKVYTLVMMPEDFPVITRTDRSQEVREEAPRTEECVSLAPVEVVAPAPVKEEVVEVAPVDVPVTTPISFIGSSEAVKVERHENSLFNDADEEANMAPTSPINWGAPVAVAADIPATTSLF